MIMSTRVKKRDQTQEEPSSAGEIEEMRWFSKWKATCVTCRKRHFKECLKGTESGFCCGK